MGAFCLFQFMCIFRVNVNFLSFLMACILILAMPKCFNFYVVNLPVFVLCDFLTMCNLPCFTLEVFSESFMVFVFMFIFGVSFVFDHLL